MNKSVFSWMLINAFSCHNHTVFPFLVVTKDWFLGWKYFWSWCMKYVVKFLFLLSAHITSFMEKVLMSALSDARYSAETFFFFPFWRVCVACFNEMSWYVSKMTAFSLTEANQVFSTRNRPNCAMQVHHCSPFLELLAWHWLELHLAEE